MRSNLDTKIHIVVFLDDFSFTKVIYVAMWVLKFTFRYVLMISNQLRSNLDTTKTRAATHIIRVTGFDSVCPCRFDFGLVIFHIM